MKRIIWTIGLTFLIVFSSCDKSNDEDTPGKETRPTVESLPICSPIVIKELTRTSVNVSSNYSVDNLNYPISEYGYCYSTSNPLPTVSDTKVIVNSGANYISGNFSSTMNVEIGIVYYFRSYAVNEVGTSYSDVTTYDNKSLRPDVGDNITPDI